MADEIREYVRAAQGCELRGEKTQAADLLIKAAHLYKGAGKPGRALAMLRHALTLAPGRREVEEEIRRLEWLPEQPLRRALSTDDSLEEEMRRILSPLERLEDNSDAAGIHGAPPSGVLPGKPPREIPERGPTVAEVSSDAWCSFCCKPSREVGALVAGAAGAFVCQRCVVEASRLLGGPAAAGPAQAEPPPPTEGAAPRGADPDPTDAWGSSTDVTAVIAAARAALAQRTQPQHDAAPEPPQEGAAAADATGPAFELPQQTAARRELEQVLSWGLRRVLLLGESGAGKSALLKALADAGRGRLLTGATVTAHPPDDTLLLIDAVDNLDAGGWNRLGYALERHPGPAIVALRGGEARAAAHLLTEDARVGVPSTQALVEAAAGRLPVDLAEQLDGAVLLRAPDEAALLSFAQHLLERRAVSAELASQLGPLLAACAAESGRRAHELVALVRRIPTAAWRLEQGGAPAQPPKRKGRKKGGR